jgi:S1-C subfamily serine protease
MTNCPGCLNRIANGSCSMCGYRVPTNSQVQASESAIAATNKVEVRYRIHPFTYVIISCGIVAVIYSLIVPASDAPASDMTRPQRLVASTDASAVDLYQRVAPSVVTITIMDENGIQIGIGSGFIVDEAHFSNRYDQIEDDKQWARMSGTNGEPRQQCYILTNYHVMRSAVSADIQFLNGMTGTIENVLGDDEITDLALLSATVTGNQPLKPVPIAENDPRVLETVYAIGSPKGFVGSASEGKVSGYQPIEDVRWLQTTASISPGSSGGPLLSVDGTLAGVTTMCHRGGQNLNFAVPASTVLAFLAMTNFNERRRHIAEDADIQWHEDQAFGELEVASGLLGETTKEHYTDSEKDAILTLLKARDELIPKKGFLKRHNEYRKIITAISESYDSLPSEYQYMAHYVAGKACVSLAIDEMLDLYGLDGIDNPTKLDENPSAKAALVRLQTALIIMPEYTPAKLELARHYISFHRWNDALEECNSLIRLMPRCTEAIALRSDCHRRLKQYNLAANDLKVAIELSPLNSRYHGDLGDLLTECGEYSLAVAAYEKALSLPCNSLAAQQLLQYDLATAHKNLGSLQKAISEFTKLKQLGFPKEICDLEIAECVQRLR